MVNIRLAVPSDIEALIGHGPLSHADAKRIPFITQAVRSATCHLVESDGHDVGYGVLTHSF